jgi:hypothetical protein
MTMTAQPQPQAPEPLYLITAEHYERLIHNVINGAQPPAHGSFSVSMYLNSFSKHVPLRVQAERAMQRQRERNFKQWEETHSPAS